MYLDLVCSHKNSSFLLVLLPIFVPCALLACSMPLVFSRVPNNSDYLLHNEEEESVTAHPGCDITHVFSTYFSLRELVLLMATLRSYIPELG